ncbi:substrate-binding periplasmic protein [Desulforegula conservatrix]|uniref:substrate-binding periplasmic protein n=1 Tax=Desulforegula conservatrix TaxID=153026 RepID=UPI00040517BE|nr:transporter substrate-binding domain-containing protein [Desulforegula conservatrix]
MNKISHLVIISLLIISALLFAVPHASSKDLQVIYPARESEYDTRDDDLVEILKTALDKTIPTDGPYTMRPSIQMNEGRCRQELKSGVLVNIIWSVATKEAEAEFLSVKIPLRKGILGYRVFLIRKQDKDKFAAVKTLDDLKKFSVGQGHTWNDLAVFKANGIDTVTGNDYERLFEMLMIGRFDYFSRGINEAPAELADRKDKYPDMMLEENLLLYYPWPKFFYVNKHDKTLADRVERGLKIMIKDGSFDDLFNKFNQKHIDAVNLKNRRLIKLDNPMLPSSVPLDRKELWYDPFNN